MKGFLIKYHRPSGEMEMTEYESFVEATLERLRLDKTNDDPDLEIVAIGSRSEASLRRSHSRYFRLERHEAWLRERDERWKLLTQPKAPGSA